MQGPTSSPGLRLRRAGARPAVCCPGLLSTRELTLASRVAESWVCGSATDCPLDDGFGLQEEPALPSRGGAAAMKRVRRNRSTRDTGGNRGQGSEADCPDTEGV